MTPTASSAEQGHQPPSAFTDLAGSIRRITDGTYNRAEDLPEEIETQIAAIENTRGTISGRDQTEVLSAVLETTRLHKRKLKELLSIVQGLDTGIQPGSGAQLSRAG
ncbi:hypothetical protein SLS64_003518 [Diaporthe eres]|uniref:Uncharacterized protein n=1 Tax=Diaporthe eres TaxID=83184 RepID=A0ABR1PCP5_DIAER